MTPDPTFLRRFDQARSALRRHQAAVGLLATFLVAASALTLLAGADYQWELTRTARAAGLALAALATLAVLLRTVVGPVRWWTRPRTASEIEARFPELGQRIRTVIQFAGQPEGRVEGAGVRPGLVAALQGETAERAAPLPLDQVRRRGRAPALAALACVPVVLLALMARGPEGRVAIARALLVERPYTTIEVRPGNVMVDESQDVEVAVALRGRPRTSVELWTRPRDVAKGTWKPQKLTFNRNRGEWIRSIAKVHDPLDYRAKAGPAESGAYAIEVRRPLAIRDFRVEVRPPAYTGLAAEAAPGGDVRGVEGSEATFRLRFDEPLREAMLELTDPAAKLRARPGDPAPAPERVPLRAEDGSFAATLPLTRSLEYRVVARTDSGRFLPPAKHRIDVRDDRAPRVAFAEPDEALEVHPIAEVDFRIRVDDDFGIARAGIVYRFNDGEEKTLVARDFPVIPAAKPTPSAALDATLLLETLGATPLDSVTYYAFVEDNHPTAPRRAETDLRYIDIRPFRREYKLAEAGSGEEGDGRELTTLGELIARQRVNLNRATRLARKRAGADDPLKVAGFEEALLNMTREFTEGVEAFADARVDSLHKALDAMQAAVDALDRSRHDDAPPAMAEAQKFLVAAKREFIELIAENPALAAQLRSFDRRQAQKIRRPKNKDQEAQELVARIEEIAREEEFAYATIAALTEGSAPAPADQGEAGEGEPKKPDAREVADKQEQLADELRDLEGKLKDLEAASDLAKARMAKAAEAVAKSSGALGRGNSKEAAEAAKQGAGMLHEVARQVRGEIAREAAEQLAMARELAEEMARRDAELADALPAAGNQPGQGQGQGPGQSKGTGPGAMTPEEQAARLGEMAKTLQSWLDRIQKGEDGKAAAAVREIADRDDLAATLENAARLGDLVAAGRADAAGGLARDQAKRLEDLAQALGQLRDQIVAPELAALAEADRKATELLGRLDKLAAESDVRDWRTGAAELLQDLQKAGIGGLDDLSSAIASGGGWHRDDRTKRWVAPGAVVVALRDVAARARERAQEMILKDLASERDEGTPPQFRELVDRYYEVLSRGDQAP